MIALLNSNGNLKVQHNKESDRIIESHEDVRTLNEKEFHIRYFIFNEAACAACDGSKKDHLFGGYCVITDAGKSQLLRNTCKSNRLELNNVRTTEGCPFITLLDMIYKVGFRLRKGKVVAHAEESWLRDIWNNDAHIVLQLWAFGLGRVEVCCIKVSMQD